MLKPGAVVIDGHVQGLAITRSLGRAGIPVFILETHRGIARYSKYCVKSFICPDYNSKNFVDFLLEVGNNNNLIDWVLFPTNDHIVKNIIDHRKELVSIFKYLGPDDKTFNTIYNKKNLINFALQHNISVPRTYFDIDHIDSGKGNLSFPLILKGNRGLSFYRTFKKKVFIAKDLAELNSIFKIIDQHGQLDNVIVQEVIPEATQNKTVSFTALCQNGTILDFWMGVKLRDHPSCFGTATVSKSIYEPDLYRISKKIIEHLNYNGPCEIEYIFHPTLKKYVLIEINPRTWLWIGLAVFCGIDLPLLIYNQLIESNSILNGNGKREAYKTDVSWIHLYTDIFYSLKEILSGRLSNKDFIKPYFASKTFAVLSKNDLLPFIMETILLPFIASRR